MNILTFDIEEWYIEKFYKGGEEAKYMAYDRMLDRILEALDQHSIKATFFCLGALVELFPHVIRKIVAEGHEIGCHSNHHRWINKMTPEEFYKDTHDAVTALEDLSGQNVVSYRAPAFSIGESNKWAFEVLHSCGIENDASVFPGTRDFGGFPSFEDRNTPSMVSYHGCDINEFPITMTTLPIINKAIAYSGGGYFRLLPLSFVKNRMHTSRYNMCYFHILDILDFKSKLMTREEYEQYFKEAGTLKNRLIRYAKSNIGRKRAFNGLVDLIGNFNFVSIREAARQHDSFPKIIL